MPLQDRNRAFRESLPLRLDTVIGSMLPGLREGGRVPDHHDREFAGSDGVVAVVNLQRFLRTLDVLLRLQETSFK
jgi:hypothetical protein